MSSIIWDDWLETSIIAAVRLSCALETSEAIVPVEPAD